MSDCSHNRVNCISRCYWLMLRRLETAHSENVCVQQTEFIFHNDLVIYHLTLSRLHVKCANLKPYKCYFLEIALTKSNVEYRGAKFKLQ